MKWWRFKFFCLLSCWNWNIWYTYKKVGLDCPTSITTQNMKTDSTGCIPFPYRQTKYPSFMVHHIWCFETPGTSKEVTHAWCRPWFHASIQLTLNCSFFVHFFFISWWEHCHFCLTMDKVHSCKGQALALIQLHPHTLYSNRLPETYV